MQSTRYRIFNHALRLGALCFLLFLVSSSVAAQPPWPGQPDQPPTEGAQPVEPVIPEEPKPMAFSTSGQCPWDS